MLVLPAMRAAFLKPEMIGPFPNFELNAGISIRSHLPYSPPGKSTALLAPAYRFCAERPTGKPAMTGMQAAAPCSC
jgi:hypothetical protein